MKFVRASIYCLIPKGLMMRPFRTGARTKMGAILLPLALAITACGSSGPGTSGGSSGPGTSGGSSAPLINRFAGQTIHVLMYSQVPTEATQKRVKSFEKQTGITVDMQVVAEADMVKKQQLDFASHTGTYDVSNVEFWHLPQYAQTHGLEPLEKYIEKESVPQWNSMEQFVPSYLNAMKYHGTLYSLPFQGIVGILYYRKDLIKTYCNNEVPKTVTELTQCAKAITEGTNHKISGYTDRGSAEEATLMDPAGWIWGWGIPMIDTETGKSNLSSPEAVKAIQSEVTLLHDYGPPGGANIGWAQAEQNVLQGVAAMTYDTSDLAADMVDPKASRFPDEIGFAVPPTQERPIQNFFASGLSINADSQHKDAAWLFVQWATSTAVQKQELSERSDFTVASILASPEFAAKPAGKVILEAAKMADPGYFPSSPKFSAIADVFDAAMSQMVAEGPASVPEIMKKAHSDVQKVLDAP